MTSPKSIYLSYADEDEATASQLHKALDTLLDGQIFFRRFDLRAGASLAETIDDLASSAKWFILLLSSKSINSNWIKMDAKLQTIRWLQQINFNILVIKIDDCDIPKHLRIALESQYLVNLHESKDFQDEFIEIANYIMQKTPYEIQQDLFVDRGDTEDLFAYSSRTHRVIFILGMAGIGKTSFVVNKVASKLGKQPIRVKLMSGMGNSIDYIARQILKETFSEQPMHATTEKELVALASDAMKKRSRRFFLFVDNLEFSLNASNELDEQFINFLTTLLENDYKSHIVLATTRTPHYPIDFAPQCDLLRLDELEDLYIQQCMDEWLSDHPRRKELMNSSSMPYLIKAAGGLPLAAQLLVSSLKAGISPERVVASDEPRRIKLRLAAKILGTMQNVLTDLEEIILQILAFYNEAVSVDDLMEINLINKHGREKVDNAIFNLNKYLLIKENDDGQLTLHTFLTSYYREKLSREDSDGIKQKTIANEIAIYTLNKTNTLYKQLISLSNDPTAIDHEGLKFKVSSEVLRYAVPANKFLRISNRHEDADRLPIKIKGVVRDLVLFFYRDAKDYHNAIKYADRWLRIAPKDYEILLYKARALRNLGQENQLKDAEEILSKISDVSSVRFFTDRVANERGKIAAQKGNEDTAKSIYLSSIKGGTTFPETYVNLARIYLRESRGLPNSRFEEKQSLAKEAIRLLEKANAVSRTASDIFEQFYFDVYIDALEIIEDESAFHLLEDALEEKPADRRLNFRMAEILRERGDLDAAKKYAYTAIENDSISACITLANIFCSEGRILLEGKKTALANAKFVEAAKYAERYRSRSPYSQYEVADCILAKIKRLKGEWNEAAKILAPYENSNDKYIVYEFAELLIHQAEHKISEQDYHGALHDINVAKRKMEQANSDTRDHEQLYGKLDLLFEKCYQKIKDDHLNEN